MILIAGVGYQYLGDLSFGPLLVERLRERKLPDGVQVEDLSFGPIAVVQWFQDDPGRFERVIFAGSVIRGRPPGTLTIKDWPAGTFSAAEIQERVGEAVTGVINLENTLMICDHFGMLPAQTTILDLEPVEVNWNQPLSRWGRVRLGEAETWVMKELGGAPSPSPSLEFEGGEPDQLLSIRCDSTVSDRYPSLGFEGGDRGGSRSR